MKIKQPGPAMDLGETGDPFLRPGTVISDAPDPSAVNRDIEQMDRHFDHLGSGAYDQRHEAERAMRDQIVVGNYEHPEDMFAHGAAMPVRMEDAVRYSSGSQREAVAEQAAAADELLADYRALYGSEAANDSAGLHAAIQYVNRQLHRDGRLIGDFITENRSEYLRDIWYAHQAGYGTDRYPSYDDDTGRTSGISAGAPAARGTTQEQDKGTRASACQGMVTFQFGELKKVTRNMQPQGKRYYQIDMDRPVHIRDFKGEVYHRYLDESVWRDAQGNPVPEQPVNSN